MFRVRAHFCALVLTALSFPTLARIQPAAVQSVKLIPANDGATVEIISSQLVTPQLQIVEKPLRLVIDLPGSTLSTARRKIAFRNQQITGVRMNQNQAQPPVTRVVVDLSAPVRYTWDTSGNRLNIRIHTDEAANAKPLNAPAMTPATQPIAVPYAEGASGAVVEAGSRVASGSSITAGEQTSILRLTRGGEVRVCPGTTLSVATSPTGQDLMLGMNTGSIETHYHLEESSDSILTPDFRIVLPGPGEFNLAIRSDPRGDTCVSSLAGSNSSVVVAELLGNGTYEVKPEQQVLFRQGRMQSVEAPVDSCGCPPPQVPVLRAAADPKSVINERETPDKLALANSNTASAATAGTGDDSAKPMAGPVADSAAAESKPAETTAQVSTSVVFSAKEVMQARAQAAAEMTAKVEALPTSTRQAAPLPPMVVLPPVVELKPQHKGFFGRIGRAFRAIF